MQFGICTGVENAAVAKQAGWDFVEENVQVLLQGTISQSQWKGLEKTRNAALKIPAANCLVPGGIKITGPDASIDKLQDYMTHILRRAQRVGMNILVFGSGGARNIPDGFSREKARKQIVEFIRMSAPIAAEYGVTLVAEHLNKSECNVINSVAEAMTYVKEVNHPNFQCLVDSYHFWLEDEPLQSLRDAMPWIKHVHLADKEGRVPPGESGKADYRPFFKVLKEGNYAGLISVESPGFNDLAGLSPKVLKFVKTQWQEA